MGLVVVLIFVVNDWRLIGFVLVELLLYAWLFGSLDVSAVLVGFVVRVPFILGQEIVEV